MFGAALRVVDRDARVLLVDHAREGFVESEVGGSEKILVRAPSPDAR